MDIFGIRQHDDKHAETERVLRRLVEQVSQLSIDLGVTRTELRRLTLDVGNLAGEVVHTSDVDRSIVALNEALKDARVRLAEAQEAADEEWSAKQADLDAALADIRRQLDVE